MQQLILFLATRLRGTGVKLPEPRKFTREQIDAWIVEDEADMRRLLRAGPAGKVRP